MTLLCGAAICAACGGTLGRKAPAVEDTDVQARDTLPTQTHRIMVISSAAVKSA